MIFEYPLISKRSLPVFRNCIGNSDDLMNICFDTGCGITTFYMDYETIQLLYPDIQKANTTIKVNNASGVKTSHELYIIPTFTLKARYNKVLRIKNLYCCLSSANVPQIDVLLSGTVFYNAKTIITPRPADATHGAGRVLIVDTFKDDRSTMYMKKKKSKNAMHFICVYNEPTE